MGKEEGPSARRPALQNFVSQVFPRLFEFLKFSLSFPKSIQNTAKHQTSLFSSRQNKRLRAPLSPAVRGRNHFLFFLVSCFNMTHSHDPSPGPRCTHSMSVNAWHEGVEQLATIGSVDQYRQQRKELPSHHHPPSLPLPPSGHLQLLFGK